MARQSQLFCFFVRPLFRSSPLHRLRTMDKLAYRGKSRNCPPLPTHPPSSEAFMAPDDQALPTYTLSILSCQKKQNQTKKRENNKRREPIPCLEVLQTMPKNDYDNSQGNVALASERNHTKEKQHYYSLKDASKNDHLAKPWFNG